MNIFHKVTLETLKKNRVRTLVTIIGIILSAAMICAVTTFASSFLNFMIEDAIYDNGDYYGKSLNVNMDKINEVKEDKRLSSLALSQTIGYAKLEGCTNEYKPYLYVMGADDNFIKSMPVHLTSGRLPESSSEILIPEHVSANGNVSFSLGDTLKLGIGKRVSGGYSLYQDSAFAIGEEKLQVSDTRAYTVVGFYKRPGFEARSAPGYTAITAIDQDPDGSYTYDMYFKIKDSKVIYSFMEEHQLGVYTNWSLLAYSGASKYDGFYSILYGLGGIFIALIMFGSISLIYNAFAISVSERTKQFGLLVSIGATKRQIRSSVIYEALVLSIIGIPLGIIAGIGGIGLTLYMLRDKITSLTGSQIPIALSVSWISVASAVVIALVTVIISAWIPSKRAVKITAIDAIRQSRDISASARQVKTSSITYKLFGLEGMIASKYYKRSKKRYKATIVSLFMSIVLFISTGSFCMYLTESVSGVMDTYDYDIVYHVYPLEEESFEDTFKMLSEVKGVKKAAYVEGNTREMLLSPECYFKDYMDYIKQYSSEEHYASLSERNSISHEDIYFIEDAVYEEFLKEHGFDKDKYMDTTSPVALAYDQMSIFNKKEGKYYNTHVLSESFPSQIYMLEPKEREGYTYQYSDILEDGSIAITYSNDKNNEQVQLPGDAYIAKTSLKIGGLADSIPFCISNDGGILLMYPYSAIKAIMGEKYYTDSPSFYFTSSNHTATYEAMKKLLQEKNVDDLDSRLKDYAAKADKKRNIVTVVRVFAYGFIILISLIALANVFNTITTNIALRRREFAMLKSVGMTSKGFNKMMNFECILYGVRSLIVGLPVSIGVTFLIYNVVNSGYTTDFHMSWVSIGIAVFSVFAVVFATMMYSMSRIKKDNPIDALRNENL